MNSTKMSWASVTIFTMPKAGTHLTGFKTTFTTVINQFARELGIPEGKKILIFTGADIRNGNDGDCDRSSIRIPGLRDQTKTKLDNPDACQSHKQSDRRRGGAVF